MKRVTAPGLPNKPVLYFDEETKRAKVSIRHATWQSREWAMKTTKIILAIALGIYVWQVIRILSGSRPEDIMVTIVGSLILIPIAIHAIRYTLIGFLERQIFPARTTLWFTPNAIAFKSRLYASPVVVWRTWKGQPVKISFILDMDQGALDYADTLHHMKRFYRSHFNSSEMLSMVVKAVDQGIGAEHLGQPDAQRLIPITEVSNRVSRKFTLVYATAASMTAIKPSVAETPRSNGIDIDSI